MPSRALTSLVTFLTRPLAFHYPMPAVFTAQLALEANLSQLSLPFTFTLSVASSPLLAFANTGIPWSEWASIFGNQTMHFSVAEHCVKVSMDGNHEMPSLVLWTQNIEESTYVPCISKTKRAASDAERAPCAVPAVQGIRVPSLPCIESQVDSDSDSDSDSAFSFSSSSSESMTSVSSRSSSPSTSPKYVPPSKIAVARPFSPPITPHYLSRNHPSVPIDRTKTELTKYLYQGGSTNVMTGGVMLGKPTATKTTPTGRSRRKTVLLGPESNDWRRRN